MIVNNAFLLDNPSAFSLVKFAISEDLPFYESSYPCFRVWLETKVFPGLIGGERSIILRFRGAEIAGLAILKHTAHEKKLCSLRVRDPFQNTGLGIRLFEQAFEVLETERPLLTVSDENMDKFERIFDYFSFDLAAQYRGLYADTRTEYSFNGLLSKDERTSSFNLTN